MPRIARMLNEGEQTVYHVISRTALDGYPFGDIEKEELVKIIKKFSMIYLVDIFGFCIMGNHFHLLIKMYPGHDFTDEAIKKRYTLFYGDEKNFAENKIESYREKWSNLSELIKDIKQSFSRYYNKLHNRNGTLWGERFKSVIVEEGQTLINCLAYIDLNPVRAGIVKRPEDYRWSSLGYHIQSKNKDNFLSTDFGLVEFNVLDENERLIRYRRYVYEAGALKRPDNDFAKTIDKDILEKEREAEFNIGRIQRFTYRTRYFTDSGIIGSKAFVMENYQRFKSHFNCKNEKKPKSIKGLDGIYSMKRLSESL
ncbi:transposase [Desulfobacterales bacterium HSG16]|nr:transposase [Desulfobacterales bacterium HSG16]